VTIDEKEETLEAKRESIAELEAELTELKADREDLREAITEATRERDEQRSLVSEAESDLKTSPTAATGGGRSTSWSRRSASTTPTRFRTSTRSSRVSRS